MKQLFLVSDLKGLIRAFSSFKEAKESYDQMCSNHIKQFSDNPSFNYKRFQSDVDGEKVYQFKSYHRSIVKGKPRFFNDIFSLQVINITD